ncbi:ACT domain-containing protein [Streptomyces sp. WAC05292]|uniref:ACT domain-containing protein n=1 Tax=Streptomyces sp. WAC05292 TaxID=2487418 RepID=UPI0021AE3DC0|nr:ACT domain-containing protein [Streptomyces sp. WAC05292]
MSPQLNGGEYVFAPGGRGAGGCPPGDTVREEEGLTPVLPRADADRLGLAHDHVAAWTPPARAVRPGRGGPDRRLRDGPGLGGPELRRHGRLPPRPPSCRTAGQHAHSPSWRTSTADRPRPAAERYGACRDARFRRHWSTRRGRRPGGPEGPPTPTARTAATPTGRTGSAASGPARRERSPRCPIPTPPSWPRCSSPPPW